MRSASYQKFERKCDVQVNQDRNQSQKRLRVQATKVFHSCPRCISPNVVKLDGEVFCSYCGWDSVELQSNLQSPMNIFLPNEGVSHANY